MNINVFGIDPGVTTGWAFVHEADLATIPQSECDLHIVSGQMSGDENQQAIDLLKIIAHVWPCVVVIEDFVPRKLNQERHFLSPVRVSSKLELLLFQTNRRHTKQMPSTAKSTIHDEYMRAAGLWTPGQPHANDAVRHAVLFLRRAATRPQLAIDLMKPLGIE